MDRRDDLMLCRIGRAANRVLAGGGPGYDLFAEAAPHLLHDVFADCAPTAPGLYVWEGRWIVGGDAPACRVIFEGRWWPAYGESPPAADPPTPAAA